MVFWFFYRPIGYIYSGYYTVSQIKRATLVFVITFTVVKLFSKFLKLATSHIFLYLLMYSNSPPHLNYATTLPCENYNNKIGQF